MMLPALVIALLLQAAPVPVQQPPAKASVAGVVIHSGTGEPISNVRVSLARTDAALGAFAQMVAGDHPPAEITIGAEFLAAMSEEMAGAVGNGEVPPEAAAEARAVASLPLSDIHEMIVSPTGVIAVVPKSAPPMMTDSQGRFAFSGVDPGTYRLIFAGNGYAKQDYGQRSAGGTGIPIILGPGQAKGDIVMRMMAVGAIGGRILDSAGRPVAGVPIQLFRFAYDETGQKKVIRAASVQTDDRGEYRVYFISPGRYYVNAGSPPGQNRAADLPQRLDPFGQSAYTSSNRIPQNYALAYYPGVANVDSATAIDVRPGADLGGIDLFLREQQSYRVRGRVVDTRTGAPPQNASISLAVQNPDPFGAMLELGPVATPPIYNAADGTFELRNVSPGDYTVTANLPNLNAPRPPDLATLPPAERTAYFEAMSAAELARPRATAPVRVVNSDVEGVVLTVGTGASLSGRVRVDPATSNPETRFEFLRVQLKAAGGAAPVASGNAPQPRPAKPDGTFRIENVWPGDYDVSVTGLPPGFYLKEARLGETDALNRPLRLSGPETNTLDIVISSSAGEIDGTVVDGRGQPAAGAQVVLVPDRNRGRLELFKPVIADSSGRFTITTVAPGDYKLAAWEAIEPFGFFDPEAVKQADENGKPVNVKESSRQTVTVTSIPAQ